MLICTISIVIYVLMCDVDLAIGNDDAEYFWERISKNNNRRLAPSTGVKTKNEVRNGSPKQHERSTNDATKLDTSKFHQRSGKSLVIDDSTNFTRKWPMLRARVNKGSSNVKGATKMSPTNLMKSKYEYKRTKEGKVEKHEFLSPHNVVEDMYELCEEMPEVNITIEKLGRTLEYNDIIIMKITEKKTETEAYFRANKDKYSDEMPPKKIVFIVHALTTMGQEYIPCLTRIHDFKNLTSYYFAHLDKFDIFLMPMANPDGSKLFSWNKNVSPQSACIGVALDRNFDVAWNVSRNVSSCSQQYPGPFPFSEPETTAIRSVFQRYSHKIIAYIHVHGGTFETSTFKGDAVLYPRGYTDATSDDDKYIDLRADIDEAMKNASFRVVSVTVDSLYNWYGQVAGTSVDYASTIYGIPYALEFVMQSYSDVSEHALREIWSRVIDAVFNSIWKSTRTNEVL